MMRRLRLPTWMTEYRRADLGSDMIAGLTTAVMLIPQGMAYAMLAGLPPTYGLYAATIPLVVYALFGSSRQLAVGPVAMVSLLVASGVGALAEPGGASYIGLAITLAAMVGVMQLAMGLFKAGFLVNFLAHPVISGFTSAAALIIGLSQLKHLLGVPLQRSPYIHVVIADAVASLSSVHLLTLVIGALSVAALMLLKRMRPGFPSALAVVVLASVAVWGLGLDAQGVAIVGTVPSGLPAFGWPALDAESLRALLPTALTIALVGFMESISVAKAFARRHRYEIDANRELVGLGMANVAGALFQSYPVTGGFSRTAVNDQAGARSGLASIITAAAVALTLLFLTPVFHYLPKAVLAAIVMTAVFGLVDVKEVKHLYQVKRADLGLLAVTFVATLALGIEEGILTGVVVSLLAFMVRTTRPHTAVLGRLPGTTSYRNLLNHPEAEPQPGLLIVRMDAQFYFGNVSFLKERVRALEAEAGAGLRALIIDASSINQLDSSADTALHELLEDHQRRGVALHFANIKGPVRAVMQRSGLLEKLGLEHDHLCVHDAVCAALEGGADEVEQVVATQGRERAAEQGDALSSTHGRGVWVASA